MNTKLIKSITGKVETMAERLDAARAEVERLAEVNRQQKQEFTQLRDALTEAERARLSQPFPKGRTDEQKYADAALLGKQLRLLFAPKPSPQVLAARGLLIGLGATLLTLALMLTFVYVIR